ncbi:MAG TPA: hypothetical protein EYQ27_13565 [Gemmatimonadetes bacterium]|nr:hypothetical protein [Gemmatimonadota bacterium]
MNGGNGHQGDVNIDNEKKDIQWIEKSGWEDAHERLAGVLQTIPQQTVALLEGAQHIEKIRVCPRINIE